MKKTHPAWRGLGRMIWDAMHAIEVLIELGVNSEKIGAIGHSLGGKQVLFASAFEKRIKVGVSSDGGIGLRFSNWNDAWYLDQDVRAKEFELENHQVLAMIAPRAFLLVGGQYDTDCAWPFIAGAIPLWRSYGKAEDIGWFRHEAGHSWPKEAQDEGYRFLDTYLK
jgi:hypothetical protein